MNCRLLCTEVKPKFDVFCFGSVMPEDDWFAEVAQIAIKMLLGKANFGSMDQDGTSPALPGSPTLMSPGADN